METPMTKTPTTLPEKIDALEEKANRLEDHAREAGLLPEKADEDEGVGRMTGLVP
jgi:hypothetical protein